jgi:hypothetical protein
MCKSLQERLDAQWGVVKEGRQRVGREIKHNTEGLDCRFKDTSPLGRSTEGPLPSGSSQLKSPAWSRKRKRDDKDDASKKKIVDYLGKAACPDGQCVQCGQSSHCRCPRCPPYIGHVCSNCKNSAKGEGKAVKVRSQHPTRNNPEIDGPNAVHWNSALLDMCS